MASDRDACLAAGMNAHVGKPFALAPLVELLLKLTCNTSKTATVETCEKTSTATLLLTNAVKSNSAPPLPPVDAVDIAGALDRLGGNLTLYVRVLQSYLIDIAALPGEFDICMTHHDLATAMRLLHTVKGLSATVGASYLTAVTRQLELAIEAVRGGTSPVDARDAGAWCAKLRGAVTHTQTTMGQIVQSLSQSKAGPAPSLAEGAISQATGATLTGLRELRDLLKASDMRAVAAYECLQLTHAETDSEDLKHLHQAMTVFDFSQAAQICDTLIERSTHG
jgi:HPt (histidine-containing phosphotransfer) domain-containing protein